jgi:PAS domain S-box-containing protein
VTQLAGFTGAFAGIPGGILKRLDTSQVAGSVAVSLAATVMAGVLAGAPGLSTWGMGPDVAKPIGAACVAVLGMALMCHANRAVALALALAATVAAATDLGFTILRIPWSAGLDALMGMPAAMALGLALAGSALVLSRFERYYLAAAAIASLAAAIAVFTLLGYVTGINTLFDVTSISSPPAPGATALFCIACGIILSVAAKPALRAPRPLWHFLVLGWAIIAPLLLFGAYAGARMADAQFNQVRAELVDEARTLSADIDREIIGEIETLEALAASPSLQHGDFAAFQRQAEAPLTLRRSGNIVLFDRNATQIVNTSAPFGTPMPPAVIQAQVGKVLATGRTLVTGLFNGPVARDVLYAIILPVKINGEVRYALARSPSQRALERVVTANPLPAGRSAAVFDAGHRIIAVSGQEAQRSAVGTELPPSQWHEPGGILEFTDSEGRPSLQADTRSELTGWDAAVWAPKAVLGAPLRALWRTLGWMGLLAVALVGALAFWVGRIISRAVGQAARAAVALGEGRPLPPSGTPVAEINTLMTELQETAAKRQAAEDFLRESERRLQLALAAAQLGSWQHDPVRNVLSGDPRARELLDIPGDETPIEEMLARVHPDDAARLKSGISESLDPVDPKRSAIEFRLRRRNGEVRWLETLGLAHIEGVGDERRAVGVVGTVADITARKEMEDERRARAEKEHLLMREMNHRAKNMLSVVDAIAHQTATRSPEDFVSRFSERIQALSANQDLLLRTEWKGVDVKGLIHAQLAHFADLIGSRISANGPALRLKAASVQAVGLAIHELATNAGKYGALSTETGRVDVGWSAGDGVFTMYWSESGGPPVSPPQRRGFGTVLMGVMAERSVGGEVELDYAPEGLRWRLTCPAASALETTLPDAGEREPFPPNAGMNPRTWPHGTAADLR